MGRITLAEAAEQFEAMPSVDTARDYFEAAIEYGNRQIVSSSTTIKHCRRIINWLNGKGLHL